MSFIEELKHLHIPLRDISLATNEFADDNYIAWGGLGTVYQGISEKQGMIAVKRLDRGRGQGDREFLTEIALLSSYKHENIVSLHGFCDEDGEKILVYKHESRGSLDKYINSKDLNWIQRLQICIDAARGLKYLHDDVGPQHRILHRDVKSSNILLNEKWKAKISDFGLSKIGPANVEFTFLISNALGTIGYVDPEYVTSCVLTKESDVFSFGVVLFEVLCGRPALDIAYHDERQLLYILAQNHYKRKTLDQIIHADLRNQINATSLSTFATIAYQCLKERKQRPPIKKVMEQLQKAMDFQLAPSITLLMMSLLLFTMDNQGIFYSKYKSQKSLLKADMEICNLHNENNRLMASSSPSSQFTATSSSQLWNYDVFLSFRGVDTRNSFADHLCLALAQQGIYLPDKDDHHSKTLVQQGISTFKDDEELLRGEPIGPSIYKAISESRIVIIIFTNNYVSSRWCLNELAYIMECKDKIGNIVMPIFYDVNPSDIQAKISEFGKEYAMIGLENMTKVELWVKALFDASNLAGWDLRNFANSHESKFIKEIVDTISLRLLPLISSPYTRLIGIETRMQDLKSQLKVGSGGVYMVGICGTWGSGKSTLVSSTYDDICYEFEACCFIKDVRAQSRMYGIQNLQEKLLSDILLSREVELRSVEEGTSMIKRKLCCKRVLIVLDDVDHLDHLKMLVGSHDWFGNGSRILITTRDHDLLIEHHINMIYDTKLLTNEEAVELFSRYAFEGRRLVEGYKKLSLNMVSKLEGHPSALISLASFLHSKDMNEWISTWARLEDIPVIEIVQKFKPGDNGVTRETNSWLAS